jgi:hypothetical protein
LGRGLKGELGGNQAFFLQKVQNSRFGKEDAGLSLNFDSTQKSKTKFLVKGISAADAHAAAMRMLVANPSLDCVLCG